MIRILHNPRCSKSRECLLSLEKGHKTIEIINYLDGVLSELDIREILIKLQCKPLDIIRVKDEFFVENYKGKSLSDDQWIMEMVKNPRLIERPIVINGDKAAIGRPLQNVLDIL